MVPNDPQMDLNALKTVPDAQKWPKIAQNGRKLTKMGQNRSFFFKKMSKILEFLATALAS